MRRLTKLRAAVNVAVVVVTAGLITSGLSAPANAASDGNFDDVTIGGYRFGTGGTIYNREASTYPQVVFTGSNVDVVIQRKDGSTWTTVKSVHIPVKPAGKPSSTVKVYVPINRTYAKPAAPQQFRVHRPLTGYTTGTQSFVVYKKGYVPASKYKGRWLNVTKTSTVARWNPCKALVYKVDVRDAKGSNSDALARTKTGMKQVAAQSGMTLTYGGTTKISSSSKTYASGADITVKFSRSKVKGGDAIAASSRSALRGTSSLLKMNDAKIVVGSTANPKVHRLLLMHETMHALGLGHSNNKLDMMYPTVYAHTFGGGDLQGLKVVGATAGCF